MRNLHVDGAGLFLFGDLLRRQCLRALGSAIDIALQIDEFDAIVSRNFTRFGNETIAVYSQQQNGGTFDQMHFDGHRWRFC